MNAKLYSMLTPSAVTGANGFLGSTLAIAILESGADVICLDLAPTPTPSKWSKPLHPHLTKPHSLKYHIAAEVVNAANKHDRQLIYYPLDVTDEIAVTSTFAKFTPTLRFPLKGLVACAGVSRNGPSTEFPAASFRCVLDTNVTGTFLIAQATANEMVKTNSTGSMVLVASMSGYVSNKVWPVPTRRSS